MPTPFEYAQNNANSFTQQLLDLLRMPSISTDPECQGAVQEAANWIADNMRRTGLNNVAIMPTGTYTPQKPSHPVVYGEWLGAGENAQTVLIYGHYDVQPAVKEDGWDNEPFEPTERNGKIIARGSSDDKGQMFIHIKAVESMLKTEGKLPVNVKLIIEGEEEIGSPNLVKFIQDHRDMLKADVCIISDTGMDKEDQPSIIYALRGLVGMEIHVVGPSKDLHSGSYGGAVHNPIQALTEIIAQLHDENGTITVPTFYDDVVKLGDTERDELKKTNPDDAYWKSITGVKQVWGEQQFTIRERIGARPTLELNGIGGGFQGEGIKTVLPMKAMAKITCRLVAHQDPIKIFEAIRDYVAKIAPPTVTVEVKMLPGNGNAALVELDNPYMKAAIRAYEKGWGAKPVFMREGGSIPIVADFQRELNAPVVLMGYGLNTDGAHGPNESFTVSMFHRGIQTAIQFLYEVGG
ncbi:MAG: dipeptidase [Phototrophicales bacterium]|nr:dipeptidase [Phototrophicales bacterium]